MNEETYQRLKETGGCFPIDVENIVTKFLDDAMAMLTLNQNIIKAYKANPQYWKPKMERAQVLAKSVRWNPNMSPIYGNAGNFMDLLMQRSAENASNCDYRQYLEFAQGTEEEVGLYVSTDMVCMHICNKMLHTHLGADKFFALWRY